MATGRPALEELERAFRDKIAEMRGLIVLRQSSAASASSAERERWLEDLTQIEERVAGVEKLAEGLAQEVDEELRQLEQAREIWRTTFFEQKSELEALYDALPPTMRPASSYSSSTAAAPAAASTATAPSTSSAAPVAAAGSSSTAATATASAATTTSATASQAQQQAPQGVVRPPASRRTMASSASSSASQQQQQPANKKQRVGNSKSLAAASVAPAVPAAPVGGALKPRHVTDAEVEKLPKYMRGRLTAAKCNEALDELSRLMDNRAKLLQLPQSAVARLKPPQSDQYLRAQTLATAARKADPPLPKRFVSEKDITESKNLRLDRMLFTTLRHLGVIREFLCDNMKCFTLL